MSDPLYDSPNPHRLYRNKERGFIGGVLAGMADYFNVDAAILRIAAVVLFLFPGTSGFMIIGYIIAWIVIPKRPLTVRRPQNEAEDQFLRGVARRPGETFSNLRYAFRDMDERLQDIERTVTSEEWRLRREFKDLERS